MIDVYSVRIEAVCLNGANMLTTIHEQSKSSKTIQDLVHLRKEIQYVKKCVCSSCNH